jgi:ribonuclease HII
MSAPKRKKTPQSISWVIGIDEVGRGPIAGPVTVCAVAMKLELYKKTIWKGLRDSKQLTPKSRDVWFETAKELISNEKIRAAVCSKSAALIDTTGISVCIRSCIDNALKKLNLAPQECLVLLDGGLKAPAEYIHQETIIKGDDKERIISLASVIAKVSRDRVMTHYHKKYPGYSWHANKGYGTKAHLAALQDLGLSPLHRRSFLRKMLDKTV